MVCEMCGVYHDGIYGTGRFCSKRCASTYASRQYKKKNKIVQCIDCGVDLEVDNRASSKLCKCEKCKKYVKRTHKRVVEKKYCLQCNTELNKRLKKFCSLKCVSQFRYETYIHDWKIGNIDGSTGKYKDYISGHIRRYLFDKYEHKCATCGWDTINSYTGKIPLQIDHIDGNYLNNSEDNLILLCPNCHSLTPTYGGANKGNGRKYRYLRGKYNNK